jgi:hypothetical protein
VYEGTDGLVTFIADRLNSDEMTAIAVEDNSAPWDGQWLNWGDYGVRTFNGHVLAAGQDGQDLKPGVAIHMAYWDPARSRREVASKRAILADYRETCRLRDEAAERIRAANGQAAAVDLDTWDRASREASILWPVVAQLATAWNDHPCYRDEWKP